MSEIWDVMEIITGTSFVKTTTTLLVSLLKKRVNTLTSRCHFDFMQTYRVLSYFTMYVKRLRETLCRIAPKSTTFVLFQLKFGL